MAIKAQRKRDENSDQLLTRFNRKSTRFVRKARNSRFCESNSSALKKRRIAVIRERYRAENEKKKHYE